MTAAAATDVIIAGGMGQGAVGHFGEKGIKVVTGAPQLEPEALVTNDLDNTLMTGVKDCDHYLKYFALQILAPKRIKGRA